MKFFKAYYLLLITALCLFVLSTFVSKEIRYTINVFDTYYVISGADFYKGFSILTLTLGLVYFVLDKSQVPLNHFFAKVHVFATLVLIATLFFFNYKNNSIQTIVIGKEVGSLIDYGFYLRINLLLIIFLQFFFLINIFVAQIRNIRTVAAKKL